MCEYCEKNKYIYDSYEKKVEIVDNIIIAKRRIDDIFNSTVYNIAFNINYCPMCGRKLC